jgi:hypothetical protein
MKIKYLTICILAICITQSFGAFVSRTFVPGKACATINEGSGTYGNPNQLSLEFFSDPAENNYYGFLIDGTDIAKEWTSMIREANAQNKSITVWYDDNSGGTTSYSFWNGTWSITVFRVYAILLD